MPRKPGTRIESPGTLGRKCWAMAYLQQQWQRKDRQALVAANLGLTAGRFIAAYDEAVPLTIRLCERVMANCFVNATFDPKRNGTCAGKIFEFKDLGFERENALRGFSIEYPFH